MKIQVALYKAAPFQMALFKEAHPKCIHIPLFECEGEVWPAPSNGWTVETRADGMWAVCELPA